MPNEGPPKTASKAEPPFVIADRVVSRGKKERIEIPVGRLPTGTSLSLPIIVIHGKRPGPTLWLNAAIHGDELNGIAIARLVSQRLSPKALAGTVIAVPIVNVFGLLNESRYLPDRRDLNRSFPGSRRGSLASQLAHLFMREVVARSEVGLDLHTGSGGRFNLPHIRADVDDPKTLELARCFGTSIVVHAAFRDGSLRAAALKEGRRVLVYEAGEANRFDRQAIDHGVAGVLRVMRHLGMIENGVEEPSRQPTLSRSTAWERARRGGFCEILVQPGDAVRKGQVVARIFDASGTPDVALKAQHQGVVISTLMNGLVNRGDALVHVAELES